MFVDDQWKGIGKIKSNQIPLWLNSLALSQKIIWFDHAPPNKGGEGAFLMYLKNYKINLVKSVFLYTSPICCNIFFVNINLF